MRDSTTVSSTAHPTTHPLGGIICRLESSVDYIGSNIRRHGIFIIDLTSYGTFGGHTSLDVVTYKGVRAD
jgi:hypothetical protein